MIVETYEPPTKRLASVFVCFLVLSSVWYMQMEDAEKAEKEELDTTWEPQTTDPQSQTTTDNYSRNAQQQRYSKRDQAKSRAKRKKRVAVCITGLVTESFPAVYLSWKNGPILTLLKTGGLEMDFFYVGQRRNGGGFQNGKESMFANERKFMDAHLGNLNGREFLYDKLIVTSDTKDKYKARVKKEPDGSRTAYINVAALNHFKRDFEISKTKAPSGFIQLWQMSECAKLIKR